MSSVTLPPLAPAHLDTPVARTWESHTQTAPESPAHDTFTHSDNTTLSYSFDSARQSLRILVTDKTSGEVLRHIEFKSFHPHVHRTDKLSGLLLDQEV